MTVVYCGECGASYTLRSDFELDGPCAECGEEGLVVEDAYDPAPRTLICVTCRRECDGATAAGGAQYGKDDRAALTVDDPCPLCEGELVPAEDAPSPRQQPEYTMARAAARRLRGRHPDAHPEEIARAEGLEVVVGPFAHQGMLNEGVVEVPETEARVAQRFLIAHEIGHHHLRHRVPESKLEAEANAFASELLIPRQQLGQAVREGLTLPELGRRFGVSKQALVYALSQAKLVHRVSLG